MSCPASRGIREKMANVIMLTAISRKIVSISRRMMNMTTVCAGAQRGIGLVGLVEVDVAQRRRPVDERLGVHDRHDHRVLHDLVVDLAPDTMASQSGSHRGACAGRDD